MDMLLNDEANGKKSNRKKKNKNMRKKYLLRAK